MAPESSAVSRRVIQAVASETDTDPLELPRLYDAIDPEALDALVDGLSSGDVHFKYAGHLVIVESDGTIRITTPASAGPTTDVTTEAE